MTALYRHYDRNGKLLYVGISISAFTRFMSHRTKSKWACEIAAMTIEACADRAEALERERAAIQAERPLWNIKHNVRRHNGWDDIFVELEAAGDLCDVGSQQHMDYLIERIAYLEAEYERPKSMLFKWKDLPRAIECLRGSLDHHQMGGAL